MSNRFREPIVNREEEKKVDIPETDIDEEVPSSAPTEKEADVAQGAKKKAAKEPEKESESKGMRIVSKIGRMLGGDILKDKSVLRSIPLMLLILFYFILMVSNRYYVETLTKEKISTSERINYLREHKIQMQKNYQKSIKISEIAKVLDSLGVGLTAGPPYEL